MRWRKKAICALFIAIIVLTACSNERGYRLYYPADDIIAVEICEVFDNPYSAASLLPEYEVIYVLSDEQMTQFIEQLSTIECEEYWNDPLYSIKNYCVIIRYNNGAREVLSTTGCGIFEENNGTYNRFYFSETVFYELISQYTDIPM